MEGAEFVGFADPKPEHRAQTKERSGLGDDMVFADYERLLDERQPDAAIICSTNADHVKYVEALAPRGIHIMLEKTVCRQPLRCRPHDCGVREARRDLDG